MTLSIPSDIWKPDILAIICQNVLFLLYPVCSIKNN